MVAARHAVSIGSAKLFGGKAAECNEQGSSRKEGE